MIMTTENDDVVNTEHISIFLSQEYTWVWAQAEARQTGSGWLGSLVQKYEGEYEHEPHVWTSSSPWIGLSGDPNRAEAVFLSTECHPEAGSVQLGLGSHLGVFPALCSILFFRYAM